MLIVGLLFSGRVLVQGKWKPGNQGYFIDSMSFFKTWKAQTSESGNQVTVHVCLTTLYYKPTLLEVIMCNIYSIDISLWNHGMNQKIFQTVLDKNLIKFTIDVGTLENISYIKVCTMVPHNNTVHIEFS